MKNINHALSMLHYTVCSFSPDATETAKGGVNWKLIPTMELHQLLSQVAEKARIFL
jgi:hypothetical protein